MRKQREQKPQNYQCYDDFFQYAPPRVSKEGFHKYMQPKSTTVYTTNINKLEEYDYTILNSLVPLTPISKAIIETPRSLITNIWINIGKKYAFAYPPINPDKELTATLNVTKFPFYYNADPKHNPDKKALFIPLYKQDWALKNGELGTYVRPIYLGRHFMGVAGFTLNVREIASVINALDLPFEAHAMLMDKENTKMPHRSGSMMIDMKSIDDPRFIAHTMAIKGTDLKIVIYVEKATIFAPIEIVSERTVYVGVVFIIAIALFYLFFFWFNFASLKKLSHSITKPLQAIVNFSSQLGRKEKFHLEQSKIKELETLNTNLNSTHQELLDMLIKDKESSRHF
jgi:hypothetical protein